jgi:cysteine-rich repeat protein
MTVIGLIGPAGCIQPGLAVCADGRACPAGLVCDDVHHGCVSPEQLAACHDASDLATCHTGLIPDGVCFGGICLPAGCGNQELEPGELCDDGNLVSGDGCSADCRSREVCGDGFADPTLGEACDDGNTIGRDGCTSRCAIERMRWARQDASLPVLRTSSAIVYDPFRRVLVMFGGQDEISTTPTDRADTWEWNGAQWREVTPIVSPPSRSLHALAYDPRRHRVVLFGGTSVRFGALDDTWEYDGTTWQRVPTPTSPSGRTSVAMTWDPQLDRIVLFGGAQDTLRFDDTWTWDGAAWTKLDTARAPSGRSYGGLVYDAARSRLLLFGGCPSGTDRISDLWTFDGTTWSALATTPTVPTAEFYSGMVYDAIHGVPIAIIGAFISPGIFSDELWELSGTTWRQLASTQASGPAFLLDGVSYGSDLEHGMVTWAGTSLNGVTNLMFDYDYDVDWQPYVIPDPGVAPRATSLAYDPDRVRTVLFGGTGNAADTYEWDGRRWTHHVVAGPPGRVAHAMAFDGVSHRVLLFGGANATTVFDDTWAWDGTTWTNVTPLVSSPPRRRAAAVAYDSARQRVVLFGGLDANDVALRDTWEWDGAAWHDVTPTSSPPAMGANISGVVTGTPAAAYDAGRHRVVVFGGTPNAETWEWDGTTWTARPSAARPAAARRPAMVYDRARGRVVLLGGSTSSSIEAEWDGSTWSQTPLASIVPLPLADVAAVYDDARAEIVRFGGVDGAGAADGRTWIGSYRGPDDEICGSGQDVDHDGTIGCADADCAGACARCGDGGCDDAENDRLCPVDCPAPTSICGDAYCAPGESVTCTADCS